MRRLRKESSAYRRFRPRVLIPLAALACCLALAGCPGDRSGRAGRSEAAAGGANWFQLKSGVFERIAGPDFFLPAASQPWTVQSRVADMAFLGDSAYCAVNGSGLASIDIDAAGVPSFAYHFDSLIFAHRTITTLVSRRSELAVHLYYNALLNTVRPEDLAIRGISLVSFLPAQANYSFLITPFQRRNPEWEAVGFAVLSVDEFSFEWKYTNASETRFAYTRYRAEAREETESTRDSYIAALGVPSVTGVEVPAALASFFAACLAEIPGRLAGERVHFAVRSREAPARRYFRSDGGGDSILLVPVFEEAGSRIALLPDGRILRETADGAARTRALPRMPQRFHYTDVMLKGRTLLVPWEESSFTEVGRAGLLLAPLEP